MINPILRATVALGLLAVASVARLAGKPADKAVADKLRAGAGHARHGA